MSGYPVEGTRSIRKTSVLERPLYDPSGSRRESGATSAWDGMKTAVDNLSKNKREKLR
jgi:hypothetical protein